jgi:carbon monoxide dehydrogenase subunit G
VIVEDDLYKGLLAVRMGPVRLRFKGEVNVTTRDDENWIGVLEANAKDSKAGGGFRAALTMTLHAPEEHLTGLHISLDTKFLGRIGELGRPLIKKKINTMMDDFIDTLNERHVTAANISGANE